MPKAYTVRYLSTAEQDLLEIFDYIKKDNPSAAKTLLERFDQRISQLTEFPQTGVIPKDDRLKRLGYRVLLVENYLVFYVIVGRTVQIRRIRGARRYKFLL